MVEQHFEEIRKIQNQREADLAKERHLLHETETTY